MGSINAEFQFVSYKIDLFQFSARQDLHYLGITQGIDPSKIKVGLSFRPPLYSTSNALYFGGIEAKVTHPFNDESLFELTAGIEGIFQVVEKAQFETDVEQDLVRFQIPAILFPYLRSAITGFFANAGLGSFMFPLINVREMAQQVGNHLEIKVIE